MIIIVLSCYLMVGLATALVNVRSRKHFEQWLEVQPQKEKEKLVKDPFNYYYMWGLAIILWPVVIVEYIFKKVSRKK